MTRTSNPDWRGKERGRTSRRIIMPEERTEGQVGAYQVNGR